MMAGEDFVNVAWTASSLIVGGFYLQQRVGSMTAFKLFGLSLMASYYATIALGPATIGSKLNIRGVMPIRWDSIDT